MGDIDNNCAPGSGSRPSLYSQEATPPSAKGNQQQCVEHGGAVDGGVVSLMLTSELALGTRRRSSPGVWMAAFLTI